jgi:hypothetical protein
VQARVISADRAGDCSAAGHSEAMCDVTVAPTRDGRCGARCRDGTRCQGLSMANGRCRIHGGASTGPRTPEGRVRCSLARMKMARSARGDDRGCVRSAQRLVRASLQPQPGPDGSVVLEADDPSAWIEQANIFARWLGRMELRSLLHRATAATASTPATCDSLPAQLQHQDAAHAMS